jgi:transcriptional regulator with XRE-family HTH domain
MSGLGQRIARARTAAGLNRNQLARALATSWQHVDHWEKGRTQPSLESLRRIAEVLGVSVDHLLGLREPMRAGALERFLAELAPADLSAEEEQWLRSAPLPENATPQHYLRLLESVRGVTPAAPQSGVRSKVDRAALAEAVRKRTK